MSIAPLDEAVIADACAAARAYLRIADGREDALIGELAASAIGLGEAYTGRSWIAREHRDTIAATGRWQRLTAWPVRAITAVAGVPADGSAFTLPPDAYAIDIDPGGIGWVRVSAPGAAGRVRVTYQAGEAAEWREVPAPLAQGAVLMIAQLFQARDSGAVPPVAVAALWRPWRRIRIAGGSR